MSEKIEYIIHKNHGDAIEGERIACQFRKMGKINVISKRTSKHGGQKTKLWDAFCAIVKPIRKK